MAAKAFIYRPELTKHAPSWPDYAERIREETSGEPFQPHGVDPSTQDPLERTFINDEHSARLLMEQRAKGGWSDIDYTRQAMAQRLGQMIQPTTSAPTPLPPQLQALVRMTGIQR